MNDSPLLILELDETDADFVPPRRRNRAWAMLATIPGRVGSAAEWTFGLGAILVGLAVLAALPVLQFLSLGYMLEASGRVGRGGRLRDGLIGVRKAARIGGAAAGTWLVLGPAWLVSSLSGSAELIDPGGPVARRWRFVLVAWTILAILHIGLSLARGGRFRTFLWPIGHLGWLRRGRRTGGLYVNARDGFWSFVASLRLPFYFRVGLVGFLGTLAWLIVPAGLIASGGRSPAFGFVGALLLAIVVPLLPFLQVGYAAEGRARALFSPRSVRDRFRRAPWAFAFALMVMLLAAIPLYLLKIEMIPREAAWLPGLLFVLFLAPARLLTGWAYSRSALRERPRHWLFRVLGRLAIVPVAMLYVLIVFVSQYISWDGARSLYDQHAFLLPVPFLGL